MIRGAVVLVLSGCFLMMGMCGAGYLRCRASELGELIVGLEAMKRELNYSLAPLYELFERAAEQTNGEAHLLFACCAEKIGAAEGAVFGSVWKHTLEQRRFCLNKTDLGVLIQLGGILGRYDADEQLKALEFTISRLEELRRQAAERSDRMGKVYTVLGFTAGMFVWILFL